MLDQEDIDQQHKLLEAHRRTLAHLQALGMFQTYFTVFASQVAGHRAQVASSCDLRHVTCGLKCKHCNVLKNLVLAKNTLSVCYAMGLDVVEVNVLP